MPDHPIRGGFITSTSHAQRGWKDSCFLFGKTGTGRDRRPREQQQRGKSTAPQEKTCGATRAAREERKK
eukprot:gene16377-biopygen3771